MTIDFRQIEQCLFRAQGWIDEIERSTHHLDPLLDFADHRQAAGQEARDPGALHGSRARAGGDPPAATSSGSPSPPKSSSPSEVASRIRAMRTHRRLRQIDLAAVTGIARPNIARLESGKRMPSLPTLMRIAAALETSVEFLLSGNQAAVD